MARARSPESALGGRSRLCQKPPEREAQMASGEMRDRPGVPHASRHLATASAAQLVERAAPAVSVSEPRPRKRCRRFVTAASCVKDGARRTPGRGPGTGEGPGSPARGQQDPSAPCAARSGSRSPEALASALRATRSSQPQSWARGASPGPTPPRLAAVPGLP